MARFSSVLFLAILPLLNVAHAASSVLDLMPDNFDAVVLKSGKPGLVEFFAPWCGHCKQLAPVYEELAQVYSSAGDKLHISKVDADEHKALGKRFGVQGFPTIKWFDGKSDSPEEYNGGRDLESLAQFITEKTGIKPKGIKMPPPSDVRILTDADFDTEIGGEKDVLVAFTTPWCGHCKNLAPIWEALATDFVVEPNVIIAKVDADELNSKATAERQKISGYPTIKYFPRGSTAPFLYEGKRTEQDFVDFVNEKAGTHRVVGGGLNSKAGTVDLLDNIVARYLSGESLQKVAGDIKSAAKDSQEKYAAYYVKVADKLLANAGYVVKELARLDKIKEKGSLAREKLDDLTSRGNILRRFAERDTSKESVKEEL